MPAYAQLISMKDRLSFSEGPDRPDGPWCEGDGPVHPAGWVDPEAVEAPPWHLAMGDDTNFEIIMGEKDELIQIARDAGVPDTAIRVYDRAARDYVPIG